MANGSDLLGTRPSLPEQLLPIAPEDAASIGIGPPLPGRPPTPAESFRRLLGRAGRNILGGQFDFPDVPGTLPFRPTLGTALNAAAQGFLEGISRGRESKERRTERAEERRLREREVTTREKTAEAQIEESRAQTEQARAQTEISKKRLAIDVNKEARQLASEIPGLPLAVARDVVNGTITGGSGFVDQVFDLASRSSQLDPSGKRLFAALNAQIKAAPGSEEFVTATLKNLRDAGSSSVAAARDEEAARKLARRVAELQVKDLERKETLGGFSPSDIARRADDLTQSGLALVTNIDRTLVELQQRLTNSGGLDLAAALGLPGDQGFDALNAARSSDDPATSKLAETIMKDRELVQQVFNQAGRLAAKIGESVSIQLPTKPKKEPAAKAGLPALNPITGGAEEFGAETALTETAGAVTGALGATGRILGGAVKAPFGVSREQIGSDVLRTTDRAIGGDERSIQRLALSIDPINLSTRQVVPDATSAERVAYVKRLIKSYPPDQVREFLLRRALGDEDYDQLVSDFAAGTSSAVGESTKEIFEFLKARRPPPG